MDVDVDRRVEDDPKGRFVQNKWPVGPSGKLSTIGDYRNAKKALQAKFNHRGGYTSRDEEDLDLSSSKERR